MSVHNIIAAVMHNRLHFCYCYEKSKTMEAETDNPDRFTTSCSICIYKKSWQEAIIMKL